MFESEFSDKENYMTKENALQLVLNAAMDRADYLEELANECYGYDDNDAGKEFGEQANIIRLACAKLDNN